MDYSVNNDTFIKGNPISTISVQTGIAAAVYDVAQLSSIANTAELSNKRKYPYYSRISLSTAPQILAIESAILHYAQNGPGWTNIAIISSTQEYGLSLAFPFIEHIKQHNKIVIETFQQILPLQADLSIEMREIKNSGARVIVSFTLDDWPNLIVHANDFGLVDEHHVWFTSDTVVGLGRLLEDENVRNLTRGAVGTFPFYPESGPLVDSIEERWSALDPTIFVGADQEMSYFSRLAYDEVQTAARAITKMQAMGRLDSDERIPAQWTDVLRSISYEGITGPISFDDAGDRKPSFNTFYYVSESNEWIRCGFWNEKEGYTEHADVVWFSNTTVVPDLDIHHPFKYWSCDDKERKIDETGKTVKRHTPDGNSFDEIDYDYHCDSFIDCHNLSDESIDCSNNYMVVFIVFGIITGFLLFVALILFAFTIVFGLILKYTRIRSSSPFFLLLILVSVIIGYSSVFAWFGKPHPVSCAFQPWLLGVSSISMISALCVKNFRLWRIFKFPLKKTKITNLELLVAWGILMIPALVILTLWAIISTPTASMKERDEIEHYVCSTGGFTGEPGGYVFFSIFLTYGTLVLLFGMFLTIVTRKVPSLFNETKLLAISIYNIAFLCVVIIPVYLIVYSFNPFIAWILRTVAILYAFTATMVLQFVPKIFYVVVVDRLKQMDTHVPIIPTSGTPKTSKQDSMTYEQ